MRRWARAGVSLEAWPRVATRSKSTICGRERRVHEDEVVPGAPQIIWRRIGTHDVVSDLSPSSRRPCRGFGTPREHTRDSSYTGATAGSTGRKTALQSQIQRRGGDGTQATRRLDIPAT